MHELDIYDSQGKAIDGSGSDPRVSDFFFDGVRLAIDLTGNGIEIVSFFRARDSTSSRSEQYYAIYKSSNKRDYTKFPGQLEERIEKEYGMMLETSTEDTTVFEMFREGSSVSPPVSERDIEDARRLVDSGHQVKFGVGKYRDAIGLVEKFWGETGVQRLAIAENADSSHLAGYDLVVEKGDHSGIEFLPETEEAIEGMRERRRRQQNRYGADGRTDDSSGLNRAELALVATTISVGAAIIVLSGVCWIGINVPFGGAIPGLDCGDSGPAYNVEINNVTWDGNGELTVHGNLTDAGGPVSASNLSLNVSIARPASADGGAGADGTATATNDGSWEQIDRVAVDDLLTVGNGAFTARVSPSNWTETMAEPEGAYRVTVEFRGVSANWTPRGGGEDTPVPEPTTDPPENSTTTESTSADPTETSTPTETATPTETSTPVTTDTPSGNSSDGGSSPSNGTAARLRP